jgi:hypothetical protein
MIILTTREAVVRIKSRLKASSGINLRPYLKNNQSKKGLGAWFNW